MLKDKSYVDLFVNQNQTWIRSRVVSDQCAFIVQPCSRLEED